MVSIVLISALLGAIDCSFLKGVTLLLQMPSDIFHCTSTYVYMVITTVTSNLQLFFINMAMKFYDQSKIGPVNVASLILLNLFCGCIILDEQQLYETWELCYLVGCSFIVIVGIWIIIRKPQILNEHRFIIDSRKGLINLPESDREEVQKVMKLLL